jgi:hypothetical protein
VLFRSLSTAPGDPKQWVVDLQAVLASEIEVESLEVFALGAGGEPAPLVTTHRSRRAEGGLELTARTLGRSAERPSALGVAWLSREGHGSLRFRLEEVPLR